MNPRYDVSGDLFLTDMAGSGLMTKYGDGRVAIATSQVIEDAVGGTVVIGDNAAAIAALQTGKEDKFNKGVANGYASLDGNIRVPTAQLENVGGTTAVTNLGSTKEDKANKGVANGYASLGSDTRVPVAQLENVGDHDRGDQSRHHKGRQVQQGCDQRLRVARRHGAGAIESVGQCRACHRQGHLPCGQWEHADGAGRGRHQPGTHRRHDHGDGR
jgi:hypothetical protein